MKQPQDGQKLQMSVDGLLSVIKFGLENVDLLIDSEKKVNVKNVLMVNGGDTILVEFYPIHTNSYDIKTEIAFIMSFLSGFFKGDSYEGFKIKLFGVRSFDSSEIETMYAICNSATAASIAGGDPIGWLKTTIFQENTSDYRLARAKTMISDLENGLRKTIADLYAAKFGSTWWDSAIESKVSNSIKNTYNNQFGYRINDGNILINYTFTLDLKKIISADWGTFRHLFTDKIGFENAMVDLNLIRRDEAHNRDISEIQLKDLERLYDFLLGEIASIYPDITVNYMIENWKLKIKEAMADPIGCLYTMDEFDAKSIEEKRELLMADCNGQINYLGSLVGKLNSFVAPLAKRKKHAELISLLQELAVLQQTKLQRIQGWQFDDVQEIISAIKQHTKRMDDFSRDFILHES